MVGVLELFCDLQTGYHVNWAAKHAVGVQDAADSWFVGSFADVFDGRFIFEVDSIERFHDEFALLCLPTLRPEPKMELFKETSLNAHIDAPNFLSR